MIKNLYRQGMSISEIARQTGHDRKAVRVGLKAPLTQMRKAPKPKVRKLEAFEVT